VKYSRPYYFEEEDFHFDLSIVFNRTHIYNMFLDHFIANLRCSLIPKPPDPFVALTVVFSMCSKFSTFGVQKKTTLFCRENYHSQFFQLLMKTSQFILFKQNTPAFQAQMLNVWPIYLHLGSFGRVGFISKFF